MVCMFSHWTEAFSYRQATASFVAKVLLEKIIPTWELLLNFIMIKEPITLVRYFNKSALFGWIDNTFTTLTTVNPLV